mmetsp:Transcript_64421/g.140270  ORF Transcript_64421/g.140270 Transcript_64421/m.140270 type:complete len:440 (-) Transcript_64421:66-1385(-)
MVERRNPINLYHKMSLEELCVEAPGVDWRRAFVGMGKAEPGPLNVTHPKFFTHVATMLQSESLDTWKVYLKFHVALGAARFLTKEIGEAHFDFFGRTLTGQKEQKPRWKRTVGWANDCLGEMLGEVYCARVFPPESKAQARAVVDGVIAALRTRFDEITWMSEQTKAKAIEKLGKFGVKIGFPDVWFDYTGLDIVENDLLTNVMHANEFEHKRELDRMDKPVDPHRWEMSPQTVNAYYHPLRNEIVFPAAFLQFPLFDPTADAAVNYGAMGAVIGHEITHGYDDQGRQFDADGNMADWWTEEDAQRFTTRAKVIVDQFSALDVHGSKVNGELTQGENIADLGGVKLAYAALIKHLQDTGRPDNIDGFTPEQRFFLSWAQVWRTNIHKERAIERLTTDPHSPEHFRVNLPLKQLPEFYAAFDVQPGQPMHLAEAERVDIW